MDTTGMTTFETLYRQKQETERQLHEATMELIKNCLDRDNEISPCS